MKTDHLDIMLWTLSAMVTGHKYQIIHQDRQPRHTLDIRRPLASRSVCHACSLQAYNATFVAGFLTSITLVVNVFLINGIISSPFPVETRVPRGSVLGLVLCYSAK